jgi:hypothetical protein
VGRERESHKIESKGICPRIPLFSLSQKRLKNDVPLFFIISSLLFWCFHFCNVKKVKCTLKTTKTSEILPNFLGLKSEKICRKKNHWSQMSETSCSMHKISTNSHLLESFAQLQKNWVS